MIFSAVILAGGQSRRMGTDKAFLRWRGHSMLARQIETVQNLKPGEILVSGRPGADYGSIGCPIIYDAFADRGPLAGIEKAFQEARCPLLLVLAVDMPLMSCAFLRKLSKGCSETLGAVPELDGRIQPLAAFYPKPARQIALALLEKGSSPATRFAELCLESGLVRLHKVSKNDARYFANWNTPEELRK